MEYMPIKEQGERIFDLLTYHWGFPGLKGGQLKDSEPEACPQEQGRKVTSSIWSGKKKKKKNRVNKSLLTVMSCEHQVCWMMSPSQILTFMEKSQLTSLIGSMRPRQCRDAVISALLVTGRPIKEARILSTKIWKRRNTSCWAVPSVFSNAVPVDNNRVICGMYDEINYHSIKVETIITSPPSLLPITLCCLLTILIKEIHVGQPTHWWRSHECSSSERSPYLQIPYNTDRIEQQQARIND